MYSGRQIGQDKYFFENPCSARVLKKIPLPISASSAINHAAEQKHYFPRVFIIHSDFLRTSHSVLRCLNYFSWTRPTKNSSTALSAYVSEIQSVLLAVAFNFASESIFIKGVHAADDVSQFIHITIYRFMEESSPPLFE
jgi:hypothetical protein